MSICKRYSRVFCAYDTDNRKIIVGRLRCKQWRCEHCAVENRKMWREFLNKRLPKISGQWWLMTLTARGDTRGRLESYKQLQHGIDVLVKRFNRAFGKVAYVRVYERHPAGEALHAHFVITGLSDYIRVETSKNGRQKYTATNFRKGKRGYGALRTFAKKTAQRSGMGYIADCKRLQGAHNATRYVTDYMTKDMQDFEIKGLRHVQTSRKIGSPKPPKSEKSLYVGYRLTKSSLIAGMAVVDLDTGERVSDEYWKEGDVYPPLSETR